MATSNLNSDNASVLIGTGTGSFGSAMNSAVGSGPTSLGVGDFTGEGIQDIAAITTDSDYMSILVGTGTGNFATPTNFTLGTGPRFAAVGDFNGDGKQDLAAANFDSANITVLTRICRANQAITANINAPDIATYNTSFPVAATSNSALPISYASEGVCTNVGPEFTMTSGTGICTVKYDQPGNNDYNPAPHVTEFVGADRAEQEITFEVITDKTFGDPDFDILATSGSGLPVSFTAVGQCTVSANAVHLTGIGTCTITASQAGDDNYKHASEVQRTFQIICPTAVQVLNTNDSGPGRTINLAEAFANNISVSTISLSGGQILIDKDVKIQGPGADLSIPNAAGGNGSDIGAFEVLGPTAASVVLSGKLRRHLDKVLHTEALF